MRFGNQGPVLRSSSPWDRWMDVWIHPHHFGSTGPGSFLDRGERSSLLVWEVSSPVSSLPGARSPRCSPPLPPPRQPQLTICWSCHRHGGGTQFHSSMQAAQLMRGFVKFLIMASVPGLIICIWLLQVRRGRLRAACLLNLTSDFN